MLELNSENEYAYKMLKKVFAKLKGILIGVDTQRPKNRPQKYIVNEKIKKIMLLNYIGMPRVKFDNIIFQYLNDY